MSSAGFIADMLKRAKYNSNLLRGKQLFKSSRPESLYDKTKHQSESNINKEDRQKFFTNLNRRRGSENIGLYLGTGVVGCMTFVLVSAVIAIIYLVVNRYIS